MRDTEGSARELPLTADLQFFGRIMANVSHEFNNVITIIGELSGLLGDLALLAERGRPIPAEKLEKITGKLNLHTVRGKELISSMNRFSHSVEEGVHLVDLRETVDNLSVLTNRLLERREATLAYTAPVDEVTINCDPYQVQRALFCSWELAMAGAAPSPALELVMQPGPDGVKIMVSGVSNGSDLESLEEFGELSGIVVRLGGRLTVERMNADFTININLPADPGAFA